MAHPVSVRVDTFGTATVSESLLEKAVRANFDLRSAGIIKMLDLKRTSRQQPMDIWDAPISSYHGEKLDKVEDP